MKEEKVNLEYLGDDEWYESISNLMEDMRGTVQESDRSIHCNNLPNGKGKFKEFYSVNEKGEDLDYIYFEYIEKIDIENSKNNKRVITFLKGEEK